MFDSLEISSLSSQAAIAILPKGKKNPHLRSFNSRRSSLAFWCRHCEPEKRPAWYRHDLSLRQHRCRLSRLLCILETEQEAGGDPRAANCDLFKNQSSWSSFAHPQKGSSSLAGENHSSSAASEAGAAVPAKPRVLHDQRQPFPSESILATVSIKGKSSISATPGGDRPWRRPGPGSNH